MMPRLEVNKNRRFEGPSSQTKVITDQTTWRDIKEHWNLQPQFCEDF